MGLTDGAVAPQFSGTDVHTQAEIALSDYPGKCILLSFSGITWCGPCRAEAPHLASLYSKMGKQFHRAIMIVHPGNSTEEQIRGELDHFGLGMPAIVDWDGSIARKYEVTGFPTTYFLSWKTIKVQTPGPTPGGGQTKPWTGHVVESSHVGFSDEQTLRDHLQGTACPMDRVEEVDYLGLIAHLIARKPVPPWPFNAPGPHDRDILIGLAMRSLAGDVSAPDTSRELELRAVGVIEDAVQRLRSEGSLGSRVSSSTDIPDPKDGK